MDEFYKVNSISDDATHRIIKVYIPSDKILKIVENITDSNIYNIILIDGDVITCDSNNKIIKDLLSHFQ
jgi:hypothetical protein